MTLPLHVKERAAAVKLLVLDVDGVLTDGSLSYGPEGELTKTFHVRDGFGIRLLLQEGIEVAIISAKDSAPLRARLADLRIGRIFLGREDKLAAFAELLGQVGVDASDVAYVGDDILDLPVMRLVGLPITVCDGHPFVRAEATWVTEAAGGRGAVREVADGLLEARGRLRAACDSLTGGAGPRRSRKDGS